MATINSFQRPAHPSTMPSSDRCRCERHYFHNRYDDYYLRGIFYGNVPKPLAQFLRSLTQRRCNWPNERRTENNERLNSVEFYIFVKD